MKINAIIDEHNLPLLLIENDDKKLKFDISETTKRSLKTEGLYDYPNSYLNKLNKFEYPIDHDAYYKVAEKIYKDLDKILYSEDNGFSEFKDLIAEAIKALNYQGFMEWFRENRKGALNRDTLTIMKELYVPDTVFDTFEYDPDKGETQEKTYILSEYVDLVGLVLFMRMLFPIFNDYLVYLTKVNKHPYFKLFGLFMDSELDYEGSALDKLRTYIEANYTSMFKGVDNQHMIINAGLSSDDIVDYLAAEALFNKLLVMDFFNGQSNPISYIFNTIRFGAKFTSGSSGLFVKKQTPAGADEDYSYFENFRKTTSLPQGTIIELQFALKDEVAIIRGLGYDPEKFDWSFYKNELQNVGELMKEPIDEVKVYLLGWFLKNFVNPRALFYMEQRKIVELLLLAKTCLYQSGQDYIGTFLVSTYDSESSYMNPSITAKSTLSKQLLQRLDNLFTYKIFDKAYTYEKSIIDFGKRITNLPWRPIGYCNNRYVNRQGYLVTPTNVNEILVEYVEFILKLGK